MDGGAQASATPIYNKFVNVSKKLNPRFLSLIMPSRWMTGGKGLDLFRAEMLNDKNIKVLHDFPNAKICFDNVEIKGGVCYFLRDSLSQEECVVFSHSINGKDIFKSVRFLKEGESDVLIRDGRLISIKDKVLEKSDVSFNTIISSMKPYGLRGDFFKDQSKYNLPIISKKPIKNGYAIIGLDENQKRVERYISSDYPLPKKEGLDKYKIFTPRNFGSGKMGETATNIVIATPGNLCTETFVQISPFNNLIEAKNCEKYMKTNLFKILLGIRKQDQGAGRGVYQFIPLQDFTSKSDIDWSKTVTEINKQLYKKYGFTKEEIGFIESMIKPME